MFSQFDDAGAVVPLNLGKNVFVDDIAPTMDDSQFDYLHETNVWFNADKTVEFEVADANSGVKTVDVFKTALDNQGNPIIGSYPERINSTLQNNRVTFTAVRDRILFWRKLPYRSLRNVLPRRALLRIRDRI